MSKLIREVTILSLVGLAAFMGVRLVAAPRQANSAVGRRVESLAAERPGEVEWLRNSGHLVTRPFIAALRK